MPAKDDAPQVICLGEAMGEIGFSPDGAAAIAVGGDTFNTAIYLARAGILTAFASMVGSDPFGARIRETLRANGVDERMLLTSNEATTGLYTISNDPDGERHFHYWRAQSAARQFFTQATDSTLTRLETPATLYFSGISLYTFDAASDALFDRLERARAAGVRLVFDGNYRPRLWAGREDHARDRFARALALCHMALPTFEDEQLLWGDRAPEETLARLARCGVQQIVLKQGAAGCLIRDTSGETHVPIPAPVTPLDTTAAGDSFNAGFLAAQINGAALYDCAVAGHHLAARVIAHRGAILPRD